jgi:hypothetical protein
MAASHRDEDGNDVQMNPDDRVFLVVVFDCPNESNESSTCKIRIRQSDLSEGVSFVSGKRLHDILVDRVEDPRATIQIYDPESQSFQTLNDGESDVVKRFGRCIRCTVASSVGMPSDEPPPAIMGRYFPYHPDTGLVISGTTLRVQETPNIPGAGTGLNVWDGAMLLYVPEC